MARKWYLFSDRIQSILKNIWVRRYRRLVAIAFFALLGLTFTLSFPAHSKEKTALEFVQEAQQYYNIGQFDEAVLSWQQAADIYQKAEDKEGTNKSLINKAQALQNLGLYPKACHTLLESFAVESPNCNKTQLEQLLTTLSQRSNSFSESELIGLRSLGDLLRRQGQLEESQAFLQLALSVASESDTSDALFLSLGNTERAMGNRTRNRWDYQDVSAIIAQQSLEVALKPYQPAFKSYGQAQAAKDSIIVIQSQLNYFSLLLDIRDWWVEQSNRRINSWSRLDKLSLVQQAENFVAQLETNLAEDRQMLDSKIQENLEGLTPSRSTIYARLNLAENLIRISSTDNLESLLNTTLQQARTLKDKRGESYALGYLGKFYERQGQLEQATKLTQQALMLAQEQNINGDAREITYLWQSQLGRLLKKQGDEPNALAAYASAFNTLQSLRTDLNTNNRDVQFDFRQEVKPVYLALTDLLLNSDVKDEELNSLLILNPNNTKKSLASKTPQKLELARQIIESMQLAELDNFFQDPCSETTDIAVQIDNIDPQAAVIYPIVLPERLEIIISLPGQALRSTTIAVSEEQVNQTLNQLYDYLYNETIDASAINIFRTIPLNPGEIKGNLQTLLPIFSQIYDWIIRPFEAELDSNHIETLVFVLNEGFQKVPMAALYDGKQYAIEKYGIALVPSLQLIDPKPLKREQIKILAAGVSEQIQVGGETFPALINVIKEIDQIEATFPNSQRLLNQEFTATTFQEQIKKSVFPVIHLATHGLFSSDPEKTFIITGDGKTIDIEQLSDFLKAGETRVPELLVLSACETATGDERAVLGLAGVAVRSQVRSTLATLWPVGDATTAEFMTKFYQGLKDPKMTKLDALQQAQISLFDSVKVNLASKNIQELPPHPYYWAPYILLGNWQ
jgi:CHAT domain-containing protein